VRKRILGPDQEMPPFASTVAPLNLPRDYETDEFLAEFVKGTHEYYLANPRSFTILRCEPTPIQPAAFQVDHPKAEPVDEPAESARTISVQEPRKQLTEAIVTACVVEAHPGQDLHCIVDFEDLSQRLGAGRLTMKQLGDGNLEITAADSEPLILDATRFMVRVQRQILQRIIETAAGSATSSVPLDLEPISAAAQSYAPWTLPLFGKFWVVAEKICADIAIAEKWQSSIKTSSNIANPSKRLRMIQDWMRADALSAFEQFILLQSSCGATPAIGNWMLTRELHASPGFKPEELGFTLTEAGKKQQVRDAEPALLAKQEKHKASATREGRHI
jgi:hypothetical protein